MNKPKRYKTYIAESEEHYLSIVKNYAMPAKAHPPLTQDIIEKVINQQRADWKPKSWSIKNG